MLRLPCGTAASLLVLGLSALALADEPTGSDLFLQAMGGKIPFPPEKIVEKLTASGINVVGSVFPNGRSLERTVTSYESPRSVITFLLPPKTPGGHPERVFLGYERGNEGMQIISENRENASFDFKVVSNYAAGKTAEVDPPRARGLCTSCHQNEGPIFSDDPWRESQRNTDVRQKMLAEPTLDPFAAYLLKHEKTDGGKIDLDPYFFQNIILDATADQGSKLFCDIACEADDHCKQAIIRGAILSTFPFQSATAPKIFGNDETALLNSKAKSLGIYPESFQIQSALSDRDSVGHEKEIAPGVARDPLAKRRRLDPDLETPERFMISSGRCIRFNEAQRQFLGSLAGTGILEQAVQSPQFLALSKSFPPNPRDVVAAVYQSMDAGFPGIQKYVSDALSCKDYVPQVASPEALAQMRTTVQMLTAVREGSAPMPHTDTSQLFLNYCALCHFGSGSPAPTLPLTDLEKMKAYVGSGGRTIASVLSPPDFLMPPEGALYPSKQDRDEMLKAMGGPVAQPAPPAQTR